MASPSHLFETYLLALRKTPLDQHTEMTGRSALQALLEAYSPTRAIITHEPRRAQKRGAPDYKVSKSSQILGYVENKAVGENLDAVLKSDQLKKYRQLSNNLLLTDYLRFIWERDGVIVADVRLGESGLLVDRHASIRPERISELNSLLQGFFSQPVTGISRAKPLPKRSLGGYRGKSDNLVGKPRYSPAERAVWINDANHFTKVPQAVWDFTIGGYQVIEKYLKSRKGRTLTLNEIENVENIVNILDFTVEQMGKIDQACLTAFPDEESASN